MIRTGAVARRFAVRSFDVSALTANISSQAARAEIQALKGLHDDILLKIGQSSSPIEPIDWAYYKENIKTVPEVVTEFEKEYKAFKLPHYVNENAQEVEAKLNELKNNAKAAVDASAARATELEQLLAELEANRTTVDTTVAETIARNPALKTEIDAELKEHEYAKDAM
eukprot:CAMPEP_0184510676 /NCGR_PEP_ID=MMETSP0198_2-20121128/1941_1 /TAXON_ID=1112570 /ORGANISM="Thraustochytrium sp., Strain LLF1b" /LENGTH=168 /DNA_ID=CAMNT_0026900583 /DNA_START=589 /DNA_END=1095 /DNA_ORIENTATION=+